METKIQVLSEDEKAQVHELTLRILAGTGVQVNTEKGRQYLKVAGADVVNYWRNIFKNFSKHVQDASSKVEHSSWLLSGCGQPGWIRG